MASLRNCHPGTLDVENPQSGIARVVGASQDPMLHTKSVEVSVLPVPFYLATSEQVTVAHGNAGLRLPTKRTRGPEMISPQRLVSSGKRNARNSNIAKGGSAR